ncbi:MAG: hypothetical protein KDA91_08120 [Planctomycetaceae bacterium]|nr:hypothetical protein [Planctomycetaceae bacterium]
MDSLEGFFAYDDMVNEPLLRRGVQVDHVSWRANAEWSDYEMVVIRSPWDYHKSADAFLHVLDSIDQKTCLVNDLQTVRWNINKHYLKDLDHRGADIVPTEWFASLSVADLNCLCERFGEEEFVCKPVVGAGAENTFRLSSRTSPDVRREVATTYESREAMVQAFVPSITTVGEYSLFYFDEQFSHCVLKTPTAGDFRVQEEHGGQLRAITPAVDLLFAGEKAIQAVSGRLLYARVDLVRLPDGKPVVMELELIEPSLYFPFDPQSPERFADAILRRMQ